MVKTSASNAGGEDLISGQGARIPHASQPKIPNIKQKQCRNKFSKDFKNGPHQKKKTKKKTLKKNSILQSCQKLRLGQFTFPVLAQGSCDARGLFLNPSLPCCGWAWPGPQGLGHSHLSQRLTSAHKPLWAPSTWQGQLLWGWNTWEVWAPRHQF